jgi:hypothetical protein
LTAFWISGFLGLVPTLCGSLLSDFFAPLGSQRGSPFQASLRGVRLVLLYRRFAYRLLHYLECQGVYVHASIIGQARLSRNPGQIQS